MIEIVLLFLLGLLVKLEDDVKKFSLILGLINGLMMLLLLIKLPVIHSLVFAVLLATFFTRKIDILGHKLLFIISMIGVLFTFPYFNFAVFMLFFIASVIDEIVSDYGDKMKKKIKIIFQIRPVLEICVFLYSFITSKWIFWISLFLFDIGYIISSRFRAQKE